MHTDKVIINIKKLNEQLRLTITDDGVGFDVSKKVRVSDSGKWLTELNIMPAPWILFQSRVRNVLSGHLSR